MHTERENPQAWRKPSTLGALLLGGILFLTVIGCSNQSGAIENRADAAAERSVVDKSAQGAESRRPPSAPDFTLALFDRGKLTLSDVRGKPVVLNFWASWCAPCREEMPGLERVWRSYGDKEVLFLGVDIQDDEYDARAFLKEMGITYPVGRDPSDRIPISYGVTGIPSTFFISREGKVARRWVGSIAEEQLVAFIEELL
ncbi:MAG: TlpA family protein disulfide reductase [Chloroflexi bacterium]|nr:TlpA family protein disulfide reductase [Chloroflexota bacterium]